MKEQKVLLITGASSDIGTAFIEKAYKKYHLILAHYNQTNAKLQSLPLPVREKMVLLQADFTDQNSVNQMIQAIKNNGAFPDHILHLSAPRFCYEKMTKFNMSKYETEFSVSVKSILTIIKEFYPYMNQQKYGKVVFMLSSAVLNTPPKYMTGYVSIKYALLGIMKSLSGELFEKGITVNGVSPAMIETKFLSDLPDLLKERTIQNAPRKKLLNVSDVIPAIEFLLSDMADSITGENLEITAGAY